MSLSPDETIWVFDGTAGLAEILTKLVQGYMEGLARLTPPSARQHIADPIQAIEVDAEFNALMKIDTLRLERLFPAPLSGKFDTDGEVWEATVRFRSTVMYQQAQRVLSDLNHFGELVPVSEEAVTAWVQTLSAIRCALHADLAESSQRLAEPSLEQVDRDPGLAAVVDWLGYKVEELLTTRQGFLDSYRDLDAEE